MEYFVNLLIDIRLEQKQAGSPTIPQAGGVYLLYYSEAENWPIAATEIPRITVKSLQVTEFSINIFTKSLKRNPAEMSKALFSRT